MQFRLFFGILSALAFVLVIWVTILYQLGGKMDPSTQLLVAGSAIYVVCSVVYDFIRYR